MRFSLTWREALHRGQLGCPLSHMSKHSEWKTCSHSINTFSFSLLWKRLKHMQHSSFSNPAPTMLVEDGTRVWFAMNSIPTTHWSGRGETTVVEVDLCCCEKRRQHKWKHKNNEGTKMRMAKNHSNRNRLWL